ncbi:hypothetical protein VNO78_15773 [Psophocarpus tetragonolobus]|uniref:Bowman-Birk serine protease inhibitors family domain-containing protein n=1 Tax=Psophocarpus tetragonolobus TaxID=3891 RepID=A0AAN9SFJ9_PSOTE
MAIISAVVTTQTENQVSLKLLVDKETNNVILAEAEKDFVDVLFSFLTFSLGTIARLVRKEHLKLNIEESTDPNQHLDNPFVFGSTPKIEDDITEGFVKGSQTFIITDDLIVMPSSLCSTFDMLQKYGIKTLSSVQKVTVNVTKEKIFAFTVLDLLKCFLLSKFTLTDVFIKKKPFLEWSCFSPCGVENNSSMSTRTDVKLVMKKSDGKVLFAQVEFPFLEFILRFLTLPLGRVTHMLGGNSSLGCVDELYKSIVDLDENKYFTSEDVKNRLLNGDVAQHFTLGSQHIESVSNFKICFNKWSCPLCSKECDNREMKVLVKLCCLLYLLGFIGTDDASLDPSSFITNEMASSTCCNQCLCTTTIPPQCFCTDVAQACHSACRMCVCSQSDAPMCRCMDQTTFCEPCRRS